MAGTVVLSSQRAEGVIRWARILATADSGDGSFPATTLRSLGIHIDGTVIGVVTNPGATGPTDNWDLTLIDGDGLDRLAGACANRDTATSEWASVGRAAAPDETLTLTFANNSVNSAVIEIVLVWTASSSAGGSSSSGGGDASLTEQQAQTALLTTIDADTGAIKTAVETIDNAISGNEMQVDVVGSLPAGTNAIGKLAANSGVDIGDVDDVVAQGKLDTIITLLGSTVATQVWKSANYTTAQTGGAIWTPTSTKKIAITHLTVGTYGTTAARLILWFGASGDTTYSAGTDQLVFAASFAPSSSGYPGVVLTPASPILAATADHVLRITTDAALSCDIAVYGYEF